ncbi:MAG: NAD(P)H-dependent glycerol-3-phosphate dehydrogenase [Saprospiraceae bacterium]
MQKPIGVIGSGSFGMTISKLLMENVDVLLYTRRVSVMEAININKLYMGIDTSTNIRATNSLEELGKSCDVIMPVIPSKSFRAVMRDLSPHVDPHHIMIHATKGLDSTKISKKRKVNNDYNRSDIYSMSEVILDETTVIRVGCISGPNLAKEILAGLPATTVIASEFDEVIKIGRQVLNSKLFSVFGSHDLKGAELAGAFKNIIAIGSGIVGGLNLGKNLQSALITRGLREMIQFGNSMGAQSKSFLGTAGIGDLIATATSENSRNYTFGKRLAQGETVEEIMKTSSEIIEGVSTLNIIHHLAVKEDLHLPITLMLYKAIYENYPIEKAIRLLMVYNYAPDVDFI